MNIGATRKQIYMGAVNQELYFTVLTYMTSLCALYRQHVARETDKNDKNSAYVN